MVTLGKKIRELREAKDLSLREFARRLKVSAAFWSDVELGRRHPSDKKLVEAARILGVSTERLKKHDTRPPMKDLKRLSLEDPAYGLAFRRVIDEGVSASELMNLADDKRRRRGSTNKKP